MNHDVMVASICGFVVAFMVGASYARCRSMTGSAAPPVSRAPAVATSTPEKSLERHHQCTVSFRYVGGGLPWKFQPEQERNLGQDRRGRDSLLHRH
jgi:cytochrome c oxidase assembly protein subunit 11